ncbi:MAG TPA: HAD family hydrolase [Chitinophagaceae bacterium]|jgi:phosphoglycolate phosphatase
MNNSFDSIIFDLDGTLWDASGTCTKAWNETLAETGYENYVLNEESARSFAGLTIDKIFQQFFSSIPKNQYDNLLRIYKGKESDFMKIYGGKLFPHVRETLLELALRFKLFIVSNCLEGYIENFIGFHDLFDIFQDYESSGNTGFPKAENIGLIIKRNQLANPVYVGDTPWDGDAAKSAGVPFIFASYGFGITTDYLHKISVFDELLKL